MAVLTNILAARRQGRKLLTLLLDPEKADLDRLPFSGGYLPDYVFVGGSTGGNTNPNDDPMDGTASEKIEKVIASFQSNNAHIFSEHSSGDISSVFNVRSYPFCG